jgi:hypothetical protein
MMTCDKNTQDDFHFAFHPTGLTGKQKSIAMMQLFHVISRLE